MKCILLVISILWTLLMHARWNILELLKILLTRFLPYTIFEKKKNNNNNKPNSITLHFTFSETRKTYVTIELPFLHCSSYSQTATKQQLQLKSATHNFRSLAVLKCFWYIRLELQMCCVSERTGIRLLIMNNAQTDNLYDSVGSIFKLMLFLSINTHTHRRGTRSLCSLTPDVFHFKGKGLN